MLIVGERRGEGLSNLWVYVSCRDVALIESSNPSS